MPEQNEQPESPPQPKEICTIRIAFPVESDEQALAYKKRLAEVLFDIPESQLHFSLMSTPRQPPNLT